MRVIRKRCLGLDLHKKQITAHLRVLRGSDFEPDGVDCRFGTMPEGLDELRQWIVVNEVTDVVMESTNVNWMYLHGLLEPGSAYRDLGAQFHAAQDPLKAVTRYKSRIELLGYPVVLAKKTGT